MPIIPNISIVIPLYNEQEILPLLVDRLNTLMDKNNLCIEIVMVNDGSIDNTELIMRTLALGDERYHCVFLSRNFGHQLAVSAGLSVANASEAIMVIDGDLQDPPELIDNMYQLLQKGNDVVYAIRKSRKEVFYKQFSYFLYYRLIKSISYINLPLDSGDFCMMSRRIVDILNKMPEESRYLRGMRSWIGFNQIGIEYERNERLAGKPKYDFSMLLRLAYNGIFNFSEFPIKILTKIGASTILLSSIYILYSILRKFFYGDVPEGFVALVVLICLFNGIQMLSLGLLGEYILRIFFQIKARPLFLIKERIVNKEINHG